jgi:hypothetical protein
VKPTNINDRKLWPGQMIVDVMAPAGRDDIESAQAVQDVWEDGSIRYSFRCLVTPEEALAIGNGTAAVWVSQLGGVMPFMLTVSDLPPKPEPLELYAQAQNLPPVSMTQANELQRIIETKAIARVSDAIKLAGIEKGAGVDLVERMLTDPTNASLIVQAVQAGITETLAVMRQLSALPKKD